MKISPVFTRASNRTCVPPSRGLGLSILAYMEHQGTLGLEGLSLGDTEPAPRKIPKRKFRKRARGRNVQTLDAVNAEQGTPSSKAPTSPSAGHIRSAQAENSGLEKANQKPLSQIQKPKSTRKPSAGQSALAETVSRPLIDRVKPSSTPRSFTTNSKEGPKSFNHAKAVGKAANRKSLTTAAPNQHDLPHSNDQKNTTRASFANQCEDGPMTASLQPALGTLSQSLPASVQKTSKVRTLVKEPMIHLPAPKPTPGYLRQARQSPTKLLQPQRLLVVLDLNGTLLHRFRASSAYKPRPCLDAFLSYCFDNHAVFVWSSATPANVRGVCAKLFTPAQQSLCLGQWARDTFGLTPRQYRQRVQVYKRLDSIWQDRAVQRAHPDAALEDTMIKVDGDKPDGGKAEGKGWGQHNTILIDDNVVKAAAQPFNHLEVPEYIEGREETLQTEGGGTTDEPAGAVLAQVTELLKEACTYNDISRFFFQSRSEGRNGIKLPNG